MDYRGYGLCLLLSAVLCGAWLCLRCRRQGLRPAAAPLTLLFGSALGVAGARGYTLLAQAVSSGMMPARLLSPYPYEYALCGALLGVLLGAYAAARCCGEQPARLCDAMAPVGLGMIALARAAETLADFGWGQGVEALRFFPVAVQDMFGQWHLAVFMLEAACALAVAVWALRAHGLPGGTRFAGALALWSATQIFCESLRAETLRWGFVRVQQVQAAVFMLAVLLAYLHAGKGRTALPAAASVGLLLLGVGVVALMEYALDKWALPAPACYAVMAAALVGMAAVVQAQRPGRRRPS